MIARGEWIPPERKRPALPRPKEPTGSADSFQAACDERHLIVADEVMTASPDFGHLGPMVDAARRELAGAGVASKPDVVVADAGYWHLEQMNAITAAGIPVLIPPDSSRRRKTATRPVERRRL
jgi:ABC-type hemin transport system substrate-binding protein